ncbi:MAG: Hpt domain-containing protein [Opitutales bacterium]
MPTPPPNDAIRQLTEILGDTDTREIVQTYLREFDGLIRILASGDRPSRHRAAHSLKSSSRHMGLPTLAIRLQELESRLLQPDATVTADDLQALVAEFERTAEPLRTYASGK